MELFIFTIIGFIATFIGTLAGSGGLIGMPSLLMLGVPIHTAIASAKFSNIFSSFSSFLVLLKEKKITFASAAKTAPFAWSGGISGGLLANTISEKTMTLIAVTLLCFALILTIIKKPSEKAGAENTKGTYPYLYGIGVYDGMFGPGQGTLLMLMYLNRGFSYLKAVAFTRFQTFVSCSGSIFSYVAAGNFNICIAIFLAIGSIIGAQTAVRLANKVSVGILKMLLHTITILLIIQLLIKIF
ncbi:sulfite exporter TauE/SafE family protein [Bacillus sp. ISL-47]|uniref:sulfite exporter TauE/SafE family protein n=1 Tax=Bacillus sp. ISL-47 TaxID=2819130 RepID=UPI001BE5F746|nr:sulfite exporter TauE/SafE family protein [Bacillus sp. ISL-47]MBT2687837.1 sulfite exporter TauE/SafE family protein [Bacillus sp. ISL-47]MBT2708086.1 sulfite exporter TauE/SafE family protein [Pseudomonas sp. ISL-84]